MAREPLSGPVRRIVVGTVINSLGNGLVFPFLLIYLHEIRGFSLSVGGAILGTSAVLSIAVTPVVGVLVDRTGARRQLLLAVIISLVGYALYPFVREPWHAFGAAILVGYGQGAWWPAQSSLIAEVAEPEERAHLFSLQRWAMNLGMGAGGLVGGLIASKDRPSSYTVLFFVDAFTFAAFFVTMIGVRGRAPVAATKAERGGYRDVIGDRWFVKLLGLDMLMASGFAFAFVLLPAHLSDDLGFSNRILGLLFLVNTMTVVLLQMPVSGMLQGRQRMRAYGSMGALFAVGYVLVIVAAPLARTGAVSVLLIAMIVFGVAECTMSSSRAPITAELAPPLLLGRYSALSAGAFQLGMALSQGGGGVILDHAGSALWWIALAMSVLAFAVANALGRTIPEGSRTSPAPVASAANA